MTMAYKKCKWLETRPGETVRKDRAYRCLYPVEIMPLLPISVTEYFSFRWPPQKMSVVKSMCAACPCFEREEKETL